jgi:hypothetical protein
MVMTSGVVLITVVIAIWHGFLLVMLTAVGRLLPLRGWKRRDGQ